MKLTGPIYRTGCDSRIDTCGWYSLSPSVPVLLEHRINRPIGSGMLTWVDNLLVCEMPLPHPRESGDFELWGRLASHPFLGFSFRTIPSLPCEAPDGVQIAEVSLTREPNIFGLPGWTLEDS